MKTHAHPGLAQGETSDEAISYISPPSPKSITNDSDIKPNLV